MQKKLVIEIGPLRLTPLGVEADGVAKIDGEEIELYICGQPHHLALGMNWAESALICGCNKEKTREIMEHPLTRARMAEAKSMLLTERKGTMRHFLEHLSRLPLVEATTPMPPMCDPQRVCNVTEIHISTSDVFGSSSGSYVDASGEAAINCAGSILKASLYLSAVFDENGEAVTKLYIPEMKPDAASDSDVNAACAALDEHPAVRATLSQMRLDLIEAAKASVQQELNRLESIPHF
jgi:hypothetical protein